MPHRTVENALPEATVIGDDPARRFSSGAQCLNHHEFLIYNDTGNSLKSLRNQNDQPSFHRQCRVVFHAVM